MKKKVLIGISCLFVIVVLIITLTLTLSKRDDNVVLSDNINDKNLINNSFLTLMLEQSDGSYQESTSNTWPGEGYIFNKELSSCQNGGELDYDSENNKVILYSNKSDGCYVYFDIYNKPIINSINLGEVTNNSITITVSATNGTNPISNYYYIINNETPVSTTSNAYTFSGLNAGETYTIKVYVVDTEGYSSDTSSLNVETENAILLADWVISQYGGVQGNNGIYYHTSSLANSAGDNSYRYSGATPNNYVCFGSDAATCPEENLYRIIGMFGDEVKLIRNYSIGNEPWSGSIYNQNNSWYSSTLNTSTLNNTFLNNFEQMWIDKISIHSWQIGGLTGSNGYSNGAQTAYNYEVGSNNAGSTDSMKIGLMYLSDYYYAADTGYWLTDGMSYNDACNYNWLCLKSSEWVISKRSDNSNSAFTISYTGFVGDYFVNATYAIRPTFYLNSNVSYASGTGTQSDPIRLGI